MKSSESSYDRIVTCQMRVCVLERLKVRIIRDSLGVELGCRTLEALKMAKILFIYDSHEVIIFGTASK